MCDFCTQTVTKETDFICPVAKEIYAQLGIANVTLQDEIKRLVSAYEKLQQTAQLRLIELEREKQSVNHWYNQYMEYRDTIAKHLTNKEKIKGE